MTTSYNATIEFDAEVTDDHVDHWMAVLGPFHGAVGENARGYAFAIVTFPAESMTQASAMANYLALHAIGAEPVAVEVMTTEEFDRRIDWAEVPPLVSVSEAAEILGVSRTRIQQRIKDKSLQAVKVGDGYVLVKSTLTSRPPGRPSKKATAGATSIKATAGATQ